MFQELILLHLIDCLLYQNVYLLINVLTNPPIIRDIFPFDLCYSFDTLISKSNIIILTKLLIGLLESSLSPSSPFIFPTSS